MPKITPYSPDKVASPLVGVPSRNPKGTALREYSKELRGTEEELNQLGNAQAAGTTQIVGAGIRGVEEIASAVERHQQTVNKHKNALAQMQGSVANAAYGDALAAKREELKKTLPNDPDARQVQFAQFAKEQGAVALDNYSQNSDANPYLKAPENIIALDADLTHTMNQHTVEFDRENDAQQTKNYHLIPAASLTNELNVLAQSDSTNIHELRTNYYTGDKNYIKAVDTAATNLHLGEPFVTAGKTEGRDKLAQGSVIQQMNASAGLHPIERIRNYTDIEKWAMANPNLLPEAKSEILRNIKAGKEDAYKQVEENLDSKLADYRVEATKLEKQAAAIDLNSSTGRGELNNLKTKANTLFGEVEKGYELAKNDKNLDDRLRNRAEALHAVSLDYVKNAVSQIDKRGTDFNNAAKAAETKVEKETLNTEKQNAIVSLGAKQQALLVQNNPDLARQQRIDLAQNARQAYTSGLITGTQYNAYITNDLKGQIKSDHYDGQDKIIAAKDLVINAVNTNPGKNQTQVHQAALAAKQIIENQLSSGAIKPEMADGYMQKINKLETDAALISVPQFKLPFMPDHPQQAKGAKAITAATNEIRQETNDTHALKGIVTLNRVQGMTATQDEFIQNQMMPYLAKGPMSDQQIKTFVNSLKEIARKRYPDENSISDQVIGNPPVRQAQNSAENTPSNVHDIVSKAETALKSDSDGQHWAKDGWQQRAIKEGTLTPEQQTAYAKWHRDNHIGNDAEYNMPAFFKKYVYGKTEAQWRSTTDFNPADKSMHFTDEFKLPNARTASKFSNYIDEHKGADWVYFNKKTGVWDHPDDEPRGEAKKNYKYAAAVLPNGKVIGLEHWDEPKKGIETFRGANKPNLKDIR